MSVAGGLALHGASKLTSISAPCSGMMDRLPTGPLKVAGSMGRSRGGNSNSFPLVWDEGFLFSVPAVFLLFNLNIQLLHSSHIPESGSRLQWQLEPPGTTWKSLHLHFSGCSQSFLCVASTLVSRVGARFLRVSIGRGCQVLLVGLSKSPQMGYVNVIKFPALTHPLCLISALSAMTYLIVNPFHLHQIGDLSKHCLPPLCTSCLGRKLSLRRKAWG